MGSEEGERMEEEKRELKRDLRFSLLLVTFQTTARYIDITIWSGGTGILSFGISDNAPLYCREVFPSMPRSTDISCLPSGGIGCQCIWFSGIHE